MTRAWLAVAALAVGSFAATWATVRPRDPAPAPASAAPSAACPSIAAIRAAVRDALPSDAPAADRAAPVQPAADDGAAGAIALDDTAYLQARDVLEDDLADGRWSEADRDRLDMALARVTGDQASELLAIVFPRLNSGEVTSDIAGPPI